MELIYTLHLTCLLEPMKMWQLLSSISQKVMWSSMILDAFSVLFASSIILMPVFANDILYVGPQGLGFLYAALPEGAVIIGFILSRGVRIYDQGKVLLLVVTIYALATIVFWFF